MKFKFSSARAINRTDPGMDPDLEALLQSPLNAPELVAAARDAWRAAGTVPALADFGSAQPLPRLSWLFDGDFYLARNPDIAEAGQDPYIHFLHHGLAEGRDPHPLVDLAGIQRGLDDGAPLSQDRLAEILRGDGPPPHPAFDGRHYLDHNPDVRDAGLPALEHFLRHGIDEGRSPHPGFVPDPEGPGAESPRDAYLAFARKLAGDANANALGSKAAAGAATFEGVPFEGEFVGMFDDVRDETAYGWAHASDEPGRRLVIEIVDGARVVGRGQADSYRADLEQGGLGDGRCAFEITLACSLRDGRRHVLHARIAGRPDARLHGEKACTLAKHESDFDLCPVNARDPAQQRQVPPNAAQDAEVFLASLEAVTVLLESGQGDAAAEAVAALVARHGPSPLLWLKSGEASLVRARADLSLEAFDQVIAAGDDLTAWAWLGRGNAQAMLGQWQEARQCYDRAMACDPPAPPAQRRLAQVARREAVLDVRRQLGNGQVAEAVVGVGALLLANPDDATVQTLALETLEAEHGDAPRPALDADALAAARAIRLLELSLRTLSAREARA